MTPSEAAWKIADATTPIATTSGAAQARSREVVQAAKAIEPIIQEACDAQLPALRELVERAGETLINRDARLRRFAEALHYLFLYRGEKHCVNAEVVAAVHEARELLGVSR